MNRKKSLSSDATSISRNACLISGISPIFPVRKRNKILNKSGNKHGPGSETSFRDFSFSNLAKAALYAFYLFLDRYE